MTSLCSPSRPSLSFASCFLASCSRSSSASQCRKEAQGACAPLDQGKAQRGEWAAGGGVLDRSLFPLVVIASFPRFLVFLTLSFRSCPPLALSSLCAETTHSAMRCCERCAPATAKTTRRTGDFIVSPCLVRGSARTAASLRRSLCVSCAGARREKGGGVEGGREEKKKEEWSDGSVCLGK